MSNLKAVRVELRLMGYSEDEYRLKVKEYNSQIVELDLSFTNPAPNLPTSLFKCSELLILRIHNFEELPPEIRDLKSIRFLSMQKYSGTKFPEALYTLPFLETLSLSRCNIQSLSSLDQLIGLRELDLIHNNIDKLPSELEELELHSLSLAGFDMSPNHLGKVLIKMKKLRNLTLGPFKHHLFPELWYDLTSLPLRKLSLAGFPTDNNELNYIPPIINNLQQLEYLWVDGNLVCFPDIPDLSLKELTLFGNPISSHQDIIRRSQKGFCLLEQCKLHKLKD